MRLRQRSSRKKQCGSSLSLWWAVLLGLWMTTSRDLSLFRSCEAFLNPQTISARRSRSPASRVPIRNTNKAQSRQEQPAPLSFQLFHGPQLTGVLSAPLFNPITLARHRKRRWTALFSNVNNNMNPNNKGPMAITVLSETSRLLKRTSWFSWWCQTILTVISCTILLFAANATQINRAANPPSFFLSALGLCISFVSILWTWGNGTRLSKRLVRDSKNNAAAAAAPPPPPPVDNKNRKRLGFAALPVAASQLLRRAIRVQVSLNLVGLCFTLLAAEEIVGSLALKVLTAGNAGLGLAAMGGAGTTPVGFIQPLDILIVQANTNILLSHFASLSSSLYLADRLGIFQQQAAVTTPPPRPL